MIIFFIFWVLPIVAGAILGTGRQRAAAGILWPLFLGWLGFIIACVVTSRPQQPTTPIEQTPGYVAGLADGE